MLKSFLLSCSGPIEGFIFNKETMWYKWFLKHFKLKSFRIQKLENWWINLWKVTGDVGNLRDQRMWCLLPWLLHTQVLLDRLLKVLCTNKTFIKYAILFSFCRVGIQARICCQSAWLGQRMAETQFHCYALPFRISKSPLGIQVQNSTLVLCNVLN